MNESQLKVLSAVQSMCIKDPSFLTHVINAGVSGITQMEQEMRKQAADMETVASAMFTLVGHKRVGPKLKEQMSKLVLSKLQKYFPDNKLFINWSSDLVRKDIEE